MIDLHCHLLPGIDDGPQSMEESLALARHAVAGGITHAVVTPHIHPGRYANTRSSLIPLFDDFRKELERQSIPLQLSLGGEVRLSIESVQLMNEGELPILGNYLGYDVVLLEFPHSHIPPGAENLVDHMLARKIRPLIAHPERNKDVMAKLEKIQPFVEHGCLLQVTAGAVAGKFGRRAHKRAVQMLEKEWVTVLASDAHNMKYRPPELEAGRKAAARIVGEEIAIAMVTDRPRAILGL